MSGTGKGKGRRLRRNPTAGRNLRVRSWGRSAVAQAFLNDWERGRVTRAIRSGSDE